MITFYELYLLGAATTYSASLIVTEHEAPEAASWKRALASFAMAVIWPFTLGIMVGNAYNSIPSK